ncbi:MAG: T9SS type A sorting domain-containing protein [Bacteroidales bacterium]|nr:T9SS type A sorting domain-containing protein [Bacteroidales bacterium]
MKRLFVFITLFLFINLNFVLAQEYISGVTVNAQIKEKSKQNRNAEKEIKSSLELPFWDDFSDSQIYPKAELWQDNYVYINSTLVSNSPSIGVATFDAINDKGTVYEHADYLTPFFADTLTSQAINLNYPSENSIYLSFYYRPSVDEDFGDVGAEPETQDSLILEFYASEEDAWYQIWSKEGNNNPEFQFVIINVIDDKFLKDGFKFRFKNIASFGSATYPSLAGNCDFWHIDYVYLNKDRTENDNIFHDIAFTKPFRSLINNFEAVPWSHYKSLSSQDVKDKISIEFMNNDNVIRIIDSLNFSLTDLSGNAATQNYFAGTFFPTAFSRQANDIIGHPFLFPYNNDYFCDFELQARIVTSSFDSAQNNVIKYTQKFRDYYAYDDGSAEAGYGIFGNGTKYGSVAYKFTPLKADYIQGVKMYFTQTFQDASQKYFWLNVWNQGNDGKPDTTIISFEGQLPEYDDELNKFIYYKFEEPVFLEGTIFIGWTQTTDDKLNIGFDYNNIKNENLFYNISGEWIPSLIEGSVMIRPVFGEVYAGISKPEKFEINIYPNPASNFLHIDYNKNPAENYTISIYNIQGKQVFVKNNFEENTIDISNLVKGLYFVRITDSANEFFNTKFIKQ